MNLDKLFQNFDECETELHMLDVDSFEMLQDNIITRFKSVEITAHDINTLKQTAVCCGRTFTFDLWGKCIKAFATLNDSRQLDKSDKLLGFHTALHELLSKWMNNRCCDNPQQHSTIYDKCVNCKSYINFGSAGSKFNNTESKDIT